MNQVTIAKPFIKWVGGKRNLLSDIIPLLPNNIENYYEPFMGGAAVFYNVKKYVKQRCYLSDFNDELVNCYLQVRDYSDDLIEELKLYKNTKEFFEEIRNMDRMSNFKNSCKIKRAARFIYLNRTAFNGMWRVNKKNQFNVPYGKYIKNFEPDVKTISEASQALQDVILKEQNFSDILEDVKEGDFVYLDPPYVPISSTSAFTSYTHQGFGNDLQIELLDLCKELSRKGVNFMQSNSNAELIYEMYNDFHITEVMASRTISAKGSGRSKVKELIITNYIKKAP